MKAKNVQGIICLVMFFLFANQAWAVEWIFYTSSSLGKMYYDKSSIKKVNENIIRVWTENILNEDGKKETFSFLKSMDKASENPNLIRYVLRLSEIDCIKEEIKDFSTIIYDEKSNVLYSSPKGKLGKWNNILSNSVAEKLKNVVCEEHVAPKVEEPVAPKEVVVPKVEKPVSPKVVVAPKVEEPVAPKEVVVAPKIEKPVASKEAIVTPKVEEHVTPKEVVVAAPAVTDKNIAQVNSKQNETKYIPEKAVRNLVTKWLNSWKSGDKETYHSCYASDFKSKGMNLDAWVSHKANVYQKSKNINIRIDKLQISADENFATAVFTQYYRSSIFKYSGKKKLELRKINDKWKIYREIM